jgi:hypothetical protein
MSKLAYAGPRVEISHHGIVYRTSKEDKYVYLLVALEILKDIDNDYDKKTSYSHPFENRALNEDVLHSVLKCYESDFEEKIRVEYDHYLQKTENQIAYIQHLPHLTDVDKEVWTKNIELMKEYKLQRALNKIYYMHCIQNTSDVIRHKKIKEITAPFNKNFFHVLNTIKGALITGKPSLDAKVIEERDKDNRMVVRLSIRR